MKPELHQCSLGRCVSLSFGFSIVVAVCLCCLLWAISLEYLLLFCTIKVYIYIISFSSFKIFGETLVGLGNIKIYSYQNIKLYIILGLGHSYVVAVKWCHFLLLLLIFVFSHLVIISALLMIIYQKKMYLFWPPVGDIQSMTLLPLFAPLQ